jgi:hypothetical protein
VKDEVYVRSSDLAVGDRVSPDAELIKVDITGNSVRLTLRGPQGIDYVYLPSDQWVRVYPDEGTDG